MRVLVLVPTTGSMSRVVRIEKWPDLPASQIIVRHRPQEISADYDGLTAHAGPFAKLGPPVQPGRYLLWLSEPIESGSSWELPVTLAHLAVASGDELVQEPSRVDIVLWSTGAVDPDLHIEAHDYRVAQKVTQSRETLWEAANAGARIIAILPASEDASEMRSLLMEIGAQGWRMESVNDVGAALRVLEQALGRTADDSQPPAPVGRTRASGLFGKILGLLGTAAAIGSGPRAGIGEGRRGCGVDFESRVSGRPISLSRKAAHAAFFRSATLTSRRRIAASPRKPVHRRLPVLQQHDPSCPASPRRRRRTPG
jgi:hypothetical protein